MIFERKVDFPTEGKPTSAIRASPDLDTSKPLPGEEEEPGVGSRSWARRRASLPLSRPRWYSVALFSVESGSLLECVEERFDDPGERETVRCAYFAYGAFHLRF